MGQCLSLGVCHRSLYPPMHNRKGCTESPRLRSKNKIPSDPNRYIQSICLKTFASNQISCRVHYSVLSYRGARPDSRCHEFVVSSGFSSLDPRHTSNFQKFKSALFRCSIFSLSGMRGSTQTGAVSARNGAPSGILPVSPAGNGVWVRSIMFSCWRCCSTIRF
jgi:hypothetical protein